MFGPVRKIFSGFWWDWSVPPDGCATIEPFDQGSSSFYVVRLSKLSKVAKHSANSHNIDALSVFFPRTRRPFWVKKIQLNHYHFHCCYCSCYCYCMLLPLLVITTATCIPPEITRNPTKTAVTTATCTG